jgi:hypothetical protein
MFLGRTINQQEFLRNQIKNFKETRSRILKKHEQEFLRNPDKNF